MQTFLNNHLFARRPHLDLARKTTARAIRAIHKRQADNLSYADATSSDLKIDIFTPLIAKDLPVFRYSVEAARKNIKHPIGKHYVGAPDDAHIRQACDELGCEFVNENDMLDFDVSELKSIYKNKLYDRTGWVIQQFMKLNVDSISAEKAVLILDSDTLFVKPIKFEHEGRFNLDYTGGYISEYDESLYTLLGTDRLSYLSFITHHMLYEVRKLRLLRNDIAQRFELPWYQAILQNLDFDNVINLSEYELYANFVLQRFPDEYRVGYWFNEQTILSELSNPEALLEANKERIAQLKTFSLHYQPMEQGENYAGAQAVAV